MSTTVRSPAQLAREKHVVVCCGAGGVGKTTTAAALSIAAARAGRRVLVLTIDPSRRLAEALGVSRNPTEPVALPPERLAAAGITAPGSLEAWMLDPKLVADTAVARFTRGDQEAAERIMKNRIYQQATAIVAGLHEYTAMEALHRFVSGRRYDLVVLDTPPSRNALDFLDAPSRLSQFLDGAIFRLFLPKHGGMLNRAASRAVSTVMRGVFGAELAGELSAFFSSFSGLFSVLSANLAEMRRLLVQPDAGFLLVTSPSPAALTEAHFFHDKVVELGLPFSGFVLNRSQARTDGKRFPDHALMSVDGAVAKSALDKLQRLARLEQLQAQRDKGLLADLALRAGDQAFAMALPGLPTGADDVGTLVTLAEIILAERRSGPRE